MEPSGWCTLEEIMQNSSLVNRLEKLNLEVDLSPEFVDTEGLMASLVARLQNLPTKSPSLIY
jgi:hypothetical protein